jgi:NTP pyrophosphatase (non-canonical NTP hydrolase)
MKKKLLKLITKTNKIEQATSERLTLKAIEELGELAEAINWRNGYKKTPKTEQEITDAILEEGIDTIICVLAVMDKEGVDFKKFDKKFIKKATKWKKKLE